MTFAALLLLLALLFCGVVVLAGMGDVVHTRFFHGGEPQRATMQRNDFLDGFVLLGFIALCILALLFSQ